jgi:LysM repeat protein
MVLTIAGAMSGYAVTDRNFYPNPRAAALTAAAAGGLTVGEVSVGRDNAIIKPLSIPTSPLVSHDPISYTVAPGDTLEGIGRKFNLPWRDVFGRIRA